MRILMKTLAAGPAGTRVPGREYDVTDSEGAAFISGGAAVSVATRPAAAAPVSDVETGTAPDPAELETATSRTAVAPAGRGRRTRG